MKRTVYRVQLTADGVVIHTGAAYASRTGCDASVAAVRAIARAEGQLYSGSAGSRWEGDRYVRTWTGDRTGRTIVATVERMP